MNRFYTLSNHDFKKLISLDKSLLNHIILNKIKAFEEINLE